MDRAAVRLRGVGRTANDESKGSAARALEPDRVTQLGSRASRRARRAGAPLHRRAADCLRPISFGTRLRLILSASCGTDGVLPQARRARTDSQRDSHFPSSRMSESRDLLDFYTNAPLL